MRIIIAGDKGSGKTTLASIILAGKKWGYMHDPRDFRIIPEDVTMFIDNVVMTQQLVDALEKVPNDFIVTTENFNTDDIKTNLPVFSLQPIPRYRMQPLERVLGFVN